jgi:hypothetical protein
MLKRFYNCETQLANLYHCTFYSLSDWKPCKKRWEAETSTGRCEDE